MANLARFGTRHLGSEHELLSYAAMKTLLALMPLYIGESHPPGLLGDPENRHLLRKTFSVELHGAELQGMKRHG